MRIDGRCHCGGISFELEWPDGADEIPARACDCSFCTKHGGVWTSHPKARLTVAFERGTDDAAYEFGTKTAQFHVCAVCGVVPVVTSRVDGALYAVVNVNTLAGRAALPLRRAGASFEGEDTASRLERRTRNWIADVRFMSAATS